MWPRGQEPHAHRSRGQEPHAHRSRGQEPEPHAHRSRGQEPEPHAHRSRGQEPHAHRSRGQDETRTRTKAPDSGHNLRRTGEPGAGPERPPAGVPLLPREETSKSVLGPRSSVLGPGWNLSFAGCGFRALYHLGALSCLLEHVPELVHGATRFSGASSGSLVAAALAVNVPICVLASELVSIAMEARLLSVGVFHPSFSLLRRTRDALLRLLPLDAHVHASRRLCVSLTRVHDGKNLLVTHFESREELVQVLLCSCFFPIYCGFIPPLYKGQRFMDGALSDNQPLGELPNSLRFSPFSGESDICPKESSFSFIQVCFGNVSIEVNTGNVHRVWTSFLPQSPQALLQTTVNGFSDALRFISNSEAVQRRSSSSEKNRLNVCRRTEKILPPELRRVLVSACSDPEPRPKPGHFTDPPRLALVLGLVLDLVLVLVRLVLLPFGVLLEIPIRCRTSDLQDKRLDKNRNITETSGEKNLRTKSSTGTL